MAADSWDEAMDSTHTVRFWQSADLPQVEANQMLRSRHVFPRHLHDEIYAVGLMDEGGSYCLGEGHDEAFAAPGEVCLLNPGQVHAGGALPDRQVSYRMLFFDRSLLRDLSEEISEGRRPQLEYGRVVVRDAALRLALERLHRDLVLGREGLALESALLEAAGELLRFHHRPEAERRFGDERGAVRRARELLAAEPERKLALAEVAAAVGLSRYHFLRVFRQATGLSPHAFRTACRLETAKQLLRQGLPLAETALATGFADQSHFTNTFRRFVGATPGQYRAERH